MFIMITYIYLKLCTYITYDYTCYWYANILQSQKYHSKCGNLKLTDINKNSQNNIDHYKLSKEVLDI